MYICVPVHPSEQGHVHAHIAACVHVCRCRHVCVLAGMHDTWLHHACVSRRHMLATQCTCTCTSCVAAALAGHVAACRCTRPLVRANAHVCHKERAGRSLVRHTCGT